MVHEGGLFTFLPSCGRQLGVNKLNVDEHPHYCEGLDADKGKALQPLRKQNRRSVQEVRMTVVRFDCWTYNLS